MSDWWDQFWAGWQHARPVTTVAFAVLVGIVAASLAAYIRRRRRDEVDAAGQSPDDDDGVVSPSPEPDGSATDDFVEGEGSTGVPETKAVSKGSEPKLEPVSDSEFVLECDTEFESEPGGIPDSDEVASTDVVNSEPAESVDASEEPTRSHSGTGVDDRATSDGDDRSGTSDVSEDDPVTTDQKAGDACADLLDALDAIEVAALNVDLKLVQMEELDADVNEHLTKLETKVATARKHASRLDDHVSDGSDPESPSAHCGSGVQWASVSRSRSESRHGESSGATSSSADRSASSYAANSAFAAPESLTEPVDDDPSTTDSDERSDDAMGAQSDPGGGLESAVGRQRNRPKESVSTSMSDGGCIDEIPAEVRQASIEEDELTFEELLEL